MNSPESHQPLPVSVAFAVGVVAGLPGVTVAPQAQRAITENNDAIAAAVLTSVDLDYVPAWARPVIEGALKTIDAIAGTESGYAAKAKRIGAVVRTQFQIDRKKRTSSARR